MFIKNKSGAVTTTEIVVIILVTLIVAIPAIYSVTKAMSARFGDMSDKLGGS